jgi:hypothetical protein
MSPKEVVSVFIYQAARLSITDFETLLEPCPNGEGQFCKSGKCTSSGYCSPS